jgi:hypothetical protein
MSDEVWKGRACYFGILTLAESSAQIGAPDS